MKAGIDISHWQASVLMNLVKRIFPTSPVLKRAVMMTQITMGGIDWARVKRAGVEFAIIKATEGQNYKDPSYQAFHDGARSIGIPIGAYHFLIRSGIAPIANQVNNFLATATGDFELPLALDVETHPTYGNVSAGDVQAFLIQLTARTGKRPILYTSPGYWNYLYNPTWGADLATLWQAQYSRYWPQTMGNWAAWSIWQDTSVARIAGINGNVDRDWMRA